MFKRIFNQITQIVISSFNKAVNPKTYINSNEVRILENLFRTNESKPLMIFISQMFSELKGPKVNYNLQKGCFELRIYLVYL